MTRKGKNEIVYLTFGNQSGGVFASYVTEVCKFINTEFSTDIRIISFVSLRNFRETRRQRKQMYPATIVLPMFPKISNWRLNIFILFSVWLFAGKRRVIALSPIAANLALMLKSIGLVKRILYDGEGATAAEWNEYDVIDSESLKKDIYLLEGKAVNLSDFRRTVSSKMIQYWQDTFHYQSSDHVIIPCSLNSLFIKPLTASADIRERKARLGFSHSDVLMVYSGSSSQWQSFGLVDDFLLATFAGQADLKLLMLTDVASPDLEIFRRYPDRVKVQWMEYTKVPELLEICDYGLLFREETITNKVAAPTKFAEYLSCGLKVLISSEVGDYSEFVKMHGCGFVLERNTGFKGVLRSVDYSDKQQINHLALHYFSKSHFKPAFAKMLDAITV